MRPSNAAEKSTHHCARAPAKRPGRFTHRNSGGCHPSARLDPAPRLSGRSRPARRQQMAGWHRALAARRIDEGRTTVALYRRRPKGDDPQHTRPIDARDDNNVSCLRGLNRREHQLIARFHQRLHRWTIDRDADSVTRASAARSMAGRYYATDTVRLRIPAVGAVGAVGADQGTETTLIERLDRPGQRSRAGRPGGGRRATGTRSGR